MDFGGAPGGSPGGRPPPPFVHARPEPQEDEDPNPPWLQTEHLQPYIQTDEEGYQRCMICARCPIIDEWHFKSRMHRARREHPQDYNIPAQAHQVQVVIPPQQQRQVVALRPPQHHQAQVGLPQQQDSMSRLRTALANAAGNANAIPKTPPQMSTPPPQPVLGDDALTQGGVHNRAHPYQRASGATPPPAQILNRMALLEARMTAFEDTTCEALTQILENIAYVQSVLPNNAGSAGSGGAAGSGAGAGQWGQQ